MSYVLKPARSATSNATTSSYTTSFVSKGHWDSSNVLPGDLVEVFADQYRASVLLSDRGTSEYLLWAANNSNLAILEDPAWSISDGTGSIPVGTMTVGSYTDGTDQVVVRDSGNRSLAGITSITIRQGGTGYVFNLSNVNYDENPRANLITLNAPTLAMFGGGLSNVRGDTVTAVTYYIEAQKFWWTRNDPQLTRFGWDGVHQRWAPYKGSPPVNLGPLTEDGSYVLTPRLTGYSIGDSVPPGMLRLGDYPNSSSASTIVTVVSDEDAAKTYSFPVGVDAVVGITSGVVQWNPTISSYYRGSTVWYVPATYVPTSNGVLGSLSDVLFVTPIPGFGEYPLLRIGSRGWLEAIAVADDIALNALTVNEGQVGWSQATGLLKLSSVDIAKANPNAVGFDVAYLDAVLVSDGVSNTTLPIGTKLPAPLVDSMGSPTVITSDNDVYIPMSTISTSGVVLVPDGTGTIPNSSTSPFVRPNGSGLVRSIVDGDGDTILFGRDGSFITLHVVDYDIDLPKFPFKIPKGVWYASKESGKVAIGRKDRKTYLGQPLYFLQGNVVVASRVDATILSSKWKGPYTLAGTETLAIAIDGVACLWDASLLGAGSFSATAVAASIQAVLPGTGTVYAQNDFIYITADVSVAIGYGSIVSGAYADRHIQGCAALGFNPGWDTSSQWLADAGLSYGVFRSSQNLDRSIGVSDYRDSNFLSNAVLQPNVIGSSTVFVPNPPLLDEAGFSEDVFFQLVKGPYRQSLHYPHNLYYQFEDGRMSWTDTGSISTSVTEPTNTLDLGAGSVLGSTLYPSVGINYGLYLADQGGERVYQQIGSDYVLDEFSNAVLTTEVGPLFLSGYQGAASGNTFTVTNSSLTGVANGYRLKVGGYSYTVTNVLSATQVMVTPSFTETLSNVSWQIYQGVDRNTYDPSILADIIFTEFNHLTDDPFTIRVLANAGVVGGSLKVDPVVGHTTNLRLGLAYGSFEATISELEVTQLGVLANGSLTVPLDTYYNEGAFGVQVGDGLYTGAALIGVNAFTVGLTGDVIEYGLPGSGIDGQLNFGADVLANRAESLVYFRQLFRDPLNLASGESELDPQTGDVNLAAVDITTYSGVDCYYVVQQIIKNRTDVVVSPLQGTVFFNRPLDDGSIVEVTYAQANVDGTQKGAYTTEQLSILVRQEQATYVDDHTWAINPTQRTIVGDTFQAWVNSRLQNYGNLTHVLLDPNGFLRFDYPVPSGSSVLVNYSVLEAFGGEQSYAVSTIPVYQPPFYLPAGSNGFSLTGDRTTDMQSGCLLRVGAYPVYIQNVTYDVNTDTTAVTIYPSTDTGVGSLAPGNDILSYITSEAVVSTVNGIPTGGYDGFMLTISALYEPASKGQIKLRILGDVTEYVKSAHLFEIGGHPYLISGVSYDDVGRFTDVTFTTAFLTSYDGDVMRVSARPIYFADARDFQGIGIPAGDVELIRYSPSGLGETLTPIVDYTVDASNGNVSLIAPYEDGISKGERIQLSFLKDRVVSPVVEDGVIIVPTYGAVYDYVTVPNTANGYLGGTLVGTYTYFSPDSFYVCVEPMSIYQGEVAQKAVQRIAAQLPNAGSNLSLPSQNNWDFGVLPLQSEIRDLQDQDRVGRQYISDYNSVIVYFEQVLETINGNVIGDRDGKFRFFVGRGVDYAPPGYEDDITGYLNDRFVWGELFESVNGTIQPVPTDPIVNPDGATQDPVTLAVSGSVMNPWLLDFYTKGQRAFVLNDMDDVVLTGTDRSRLSYVPPLKFTVEGEFHAMWYPSVISRLYPEATLAFTTTYPGLNADMSVGDPGKYSFAKVVQTESGPVLASTFNKDIGVISNPALGKIVGVTGQTKVRDRLPRARVWGFSPDGYADLEPATAGKPTLILTPLQLDAFPIDPVTGLPDVSLLANQGGDLYDLSTGDVDLSTPAWSIYDAASDTYPQLAWGKPDGSTYQIGSGDGTITSAMGTPFSGPIPKGIFVDAIYQGCIVTLTDGTGTVTNPDNIVRVGDGVLYPFEPQYGDTIYVISPYAVDASTFSDPPTFSELRKFARNQPLLDVGIRERKSMFVDRSLPSIADPAFPIKEMVNQKVADPMGCIESDVEFANTMRKPFKFPALTGQDTNDSGDYSIPYLSITNTELDRLAQVSRTFDSIALTDNASVTSGVYSDEILANDGTITAAGVNPATMRTAADFAPAFVPHTGTGTVAEFDLLLVEAGQANLFNAGMAGIQTVGAVGTGEIEPPRFVTPTRLGDKIRYTFANAMAHLTSTGTTGMVVTEFGGFTILSISAISGLVFNDGTALPNGGLNNLVNPFGATDNVLTFRLLDQTTGLVLETITYDANTSTVTGSLGSVVLGSAPVFQQKAMVIPAIGFASTLAAQVDFALSINVQGSTTGYVDYDRLTFRESYDLSSVLPRGAVTVGGVSVQGELDVTFVTSSGNDSCTVNSSVYVNGGQPFTFLERNGVVGSFGAVKVMAWEGFGNVPLPSTNLTFSAVPSSAENETGDILSGDATIQDAVAYLDTVSVSTGAIANVVPGDIVVIDRTSVGDAAVKAGTYLIRHAVDMNVAGPPPYLEVDARAYAGANAGWAQVRFPQIVSSDLNTLSIEVDAVQTVYGTPSSYDFGNTGSLYIIPNPNDFSTVLYADYSGFMVGTTVVFTIVSGTVRNMSGVIQPDAALFSIANSGVLVSGMQFIPVGSLVRGIENNLVGANTGAGEIGGFLHINIIGVNGDIAYSVPGTLVDSTGGVPAANKLGVWVSDPTYTANSQSFLVDSRTPVYENVPMFLDLRGLGALFAVGVNGNPNLRTIMPNTKLDTNDGLGTVGYHALSGIFLEPSIPIPVQDLNDGNPKVVDAGHSYTYVGLRNAADYGLGSSEDVTFTVKRIRRFHLDDEVTANLLPLRYAYEIREGVVVGYVPSALLLSMSDTQLGDLLSQGVNVNAGDEVRILDGSGNVLDTALIASILSGNVVKLRTPGFTRYTPTGGDVYQVYLKQAPVPHLQSNQQLLEATTTLIYNKVADPFTNTGGKVTITNTLEDNSVTDFTAFVKEGDVLLVDPAGMLRGPTGTAMPPEYGARPFGDQSVSVRPGPWVAGSPSQLDDNRGFYHVTSVSTNAVDVSNLTEFSGLSGNPVVYGAAGQEYVVLPEITASGLTSGDEGQMDLRRTAVADGSNSYLGNWYSIEPFSYQIRRSNGILSSESLDLVLFIRERMLSWVEEMNTSYQKYGTYYVFQRDQHISHLGYSTDTATGMGVPSNAFITSFIGLTAYAPFANTNDCLSVLDRRYWCLDVRLDREYPPYIVGGEPYASFEEDNSMSGYTIGSGRPVEPDRILSVLNDDDQLRDLRYAWIDFRANRVSGTLMNIDRFYQELPGRLEAQREWLLMNSKLQ